MNESETASVEAELLERLRAIEAAEERACPRHRPFRCGAASLCIPQSYVCDGAQDCPGREDERSGLCGLRPCLGKMDCRTRFGHNRCISPDACCSPRLDPDCQHPPLCCASLLRTHFDGYNHPRPRDAYPRGLSYGYQSAVLVVTTSSLAFALLVLLGFLAIARYVRARLLATHPRRRRGSSSGGQSSSHPSSSAEVTQRLIVEYSAGGALRIYGSAPHPPPYSTLPRNAAPLPPPALNEDAPPAYEETNWPGPSTSSPPPPPPHLPPPPPPAPNPQDPAPLNASEQRGQ